MLLITIIRKFISDVWKSIKRKWQYIRNYYHYFLYGIKNQKIHIFTLVVKFILFVTGIIAYFEEPSENNIILFLCALFNFFWSFYGLIKEPVEYIKPEFYMEKKIEKEGTLVEKEKVLKNEEFKNHNRKYKLNCNLVQQIRKKSSKKIDMQSQKHKTESQCISTQNISSNYQDEYMFYLLFLTETCICSEKKVYSRKPSLKIPFTVFLTAPKLTRRVLQHCFLRISPTIL